jgi:hypothetical protein
MMEEQNRDEAAPVQRFVSPLFREGDVVRILCGDEGYQGTLGIVEKVFRSGRCQVGIKPMGFLNLPPEGIEHVESV